MPPRGAGLGGASGELPEGPSSIRVRCEAPGIGWEWDPRYIKHREVITQMV